MSDSKDVLKAEVPSKQPGAGPRFVNFIISKPWAALPLGLLLVAVLTAGAGVRGITANFTHTAFFHDDDKLLKEFNQFERQYGNDDTVVVVVHSPSGIFDVDSATLIQEITKRMWLVPDIIRVDSVANFSWVHAYEDDIEVEPLLPEPEDIVLDEKDPESVKLLAERAKVALSHETLPNYLISEDGKTALIYARVRPGFEEPPDAGRIVLATRELVKELARTDHKFHLTGGPTINFAFRETSERDFQTLIPIVLLMALAALVLLLRGIGGVLLPVVVMGTSIAAAMGVAGWAGLEISSVTIVLPQILIGVAVADSVHILSGFYRARRLGLDKTAAIRKTLTSNFVPTILTSLSTAVGFFAFSTSGLKPIFGLGMLAGAGTIVAWFASYLVMGPLLVWFPSWVKKKGEESQLREPGPRSLAYTRWLYRRRWIVIGGYILLTGGALVLASSNAVNSDPYKYFAKEYPIRKAQDFILDNLAGIAGYEMSINAGSEGGAKDPEFLKRVEAFDKRVVALEGVSKSVSLVDVFKQTNRSLHGDSQAEYKLPDSKELLAQEFFLYTMSLPQGLDVNDRVTVKHDAIRMTLISTLTESAKWTATADEIESIGKELGLDVTISGKTMLYQSMNGYVTRSFIQSLLIAVVLVSLILIVAFRSFRLGMVAMLPNLIPLVIGGAVLRILGQSLDIGTVLVCSVCLGIAVDDTIHVLASFRRYKGEGYDDDRAMGMMFSHTGPALMVTTLVLVCAFGTLGFATFVPNIYFGIMTAVILTTAVITDFTFLPALLLTISRRNEKKV